MANIRTIRSAKEIRAARRSDRYDREPRVYVHIDQLTANERSALVTLNKLLTSVEIKYHPMATKIAKELSARKFDESDWLDDYELELELYFILSESDPAWDDEDDENNSIATLSINCKDTHLEIDRGLDWGMGAFHTNHIEFPNGEEHHCYLYHCLSSQCSLNWGDIARIAEVGVDVIIKEQSYLLVSNIT